MQSKKMTVLFRKLFTSCSTSLLRRNLHTTFIRNTYDGDGKTTVTILNKNFDYGLMIDNISERGFVLNNGIHTVGPMIMFPKTMLSWNIAASPDMNEDSFALLLNLEPKLDIVVIGLDDEYPYNAPFLLNIRDIFRKRKIPLEILPTYLACSTFNFLNAEHRYAAAALIPPRTLYIEDILLQQGAEQKTIGEKTKAAITVIDDLETDPLVPEALVINKSKLSRKKQAEEAFKIRSAFRPDVKTRGESSDTTIDSPDKNKKD